MKAALRAGRAEPNTRPVPRAKDTPALSLRHPPTSVVDRPAAMPTPTSITGPRRLAACSCGQLTAQVEGDPVRVSVCHCLACQRRTGSVFGQQARFHRDQVTTAGESTVFVRVGDEGSTARFHFCPRCGATVWYEMDGLPEHLAVPVGAFADPAFPSPTVSVYEERQHGWVVMPADVEHWR